MLHAHQVAIYTRQFASRFLGADKSAQQIAVCEEAFTKVGITLVLPMFTIDIPNMEYWTGYIPLIFTFFPVDIYTVVYVNSPFCWLYSWLITSGNTNR